MVQGGPGSVIRVSQRYRWYNQCYCSQEINGRRSQNCLSNGYENSNLSLSHAKSYPSAIKPGWPAYLAIEKICRHAGNLEPQEIILNLYHWPSAKPLCWLLLNSGDKEVQFVSLTDHLWSQHVSTLFCIIIKYNNCPLKSKTWKRAWGSRSNVL